MTTRCGVALVCLSLCLGWCGCDGSTSSSSSGASGGSGSSSPGGLLDALGGSSNISIEGYTAADEARFRKYSDLTQKFGDHLWREQWQAAYDMTSTSLRAILPLEKFIESHRANYPHYHQYGKPLKVLGIANEVDPAEITREDYEIPATVPASPAWEAWGLAEMVVEWDEDEGEDGADEEESIARCFDIGLLWVTEDGQDRVAYFEYFWCD